MIAKDLTQQERVQNAIEQVKAKCAGKEFSDIIDGAGHQYVDFVMEGGGVLGVALTGYSYLLEQAGLRFLGLGGTSAGSINALVIAALGAPHEAKSEKLAEILANIPMASFMDGDGDARQFTNAMLKKTSLVKMLFWTGLVIDNVLDDLGLHPGDAFLEWLTVVLKKAGISTTKQLLDRLVTPPPGVLKLRDGTSLASDETCGSLALVAADVTTETKVDFPRMAKMFWKNWENINPAFFARASMSIPFFFHPFHVDAVPWDSETQKVWDELTGYQGKWPERCVFMDGGIISNFPINLFHKTDRVPRVPTFGAKIGLDRATPGYQPAKVTKPSELLGAVFDSARHALDFDFILRNPDYRHLVAFIKIDDRHNWLDFNLDEEAKLDLFATGAETAARFLCGFDWEGYKKLRKELADADKKSRKMRRTL